MQIEIAGHQPGFKAWAMVSSALLAVFCVLGGACVLHCQSLLETYGDIDLPGGLKLGLQIGLTGVAFTWCGYMGLIAASLLPVRGRLWLQLGTVVWLLIAAWVTRLVIGGWLHLMFSGMRSVM
jgi:hypothetical protein